MKTEKESYNTITQNDIINILSGNPEVNVFIIEIPGCENIIICRTSWLLKYGDIFPTINFGNQPLSPNWGYARTRLQINLREPVRSVYNAENEHGDLYRIDDTEKSVADLSAEYEQIKEHLTPVEIKIHLL